MRTRSSSRASYEVNIIGSDVMDWVDHEILIVSKAFLLKPRELHRSARNFELDRVGVSSLWSSGSELCGSPPYPLCGNRDRIAGIHGMLGRVYKACSVEGDHRAQELHPGSIDVGVVEGVLDDEEDLANQGGCECFLSYFGFWFTHLRIILFCLISN